jgi:hypothetical protein
LCFFGFGFLSDFRLTFMSALIASSKLSGWSETGVGGEGAAPPRHAIQAEQDLGGRVVEL